MHKPWESFMDKIETSKNKGMEKEDFDFEINDNAVMYKQYDIKKYVIKYLKAVPKEDLHGIARINIYDDSPSHFPKDKSGGYYPAGSLGQSAEIDLFLDQILGCMLNETREKAFLSMLSNELFLLLAGKLFLANTLFHEIGHHKYAIISPKQYKTQEEIEEDAKTYATQLLWKIYPVRYRYYNAMNKLYKFLYKKRIEKYEKRKSQVAAYNPDYFDYMGKTYLEQKEYEKAIKEFDQLIDLEPAYRNAYLKRGLAKGYMGKYQEALGDFTSAVRINPSDPIAYYNRGFCYHSMGEWDKAIEDYSRAIELNYPYSDIYFNRSQCYKVLKELEKADKDLQEAIKRGFDISEQKTNDAEGKKEDQEVKPSNTN